MTPGVDNAILKDLFISECSQTIIRLKRNTKLVHKGKETPVSKLLEKVDFSITQRVKKVKKTKEVLEDYELGAIPVSYTIKGVVHPVWLVVSRNERHGGLCYLLVKSERNSAIEVAKWAFKDYGFRWKIEEYHRHVKQEYNLEDIQIKTFTGLQSMLALLTTAMHMIYKKIQSLHVCLLLDSGYNYLVKNTISELTNFIYYKVSRVVSILLMPTKSRWKSVKTPPDKNPGQLNLTFN